MGSIAPAATDVDEALSPRQTASTADNATEGSPTATRSVNNALVSMNIRADPDAQATITDFLDFTEYLPSDMTRSLTLIGKLDQTYIDASVNVHKLTTKWGQLPNLPPEERSAPVQLRAEISENLGNAVSARTYSYAEASRMAENVAKHHNRAKSILAKLKIMLENWPPPEEQKSPVATAKSPQVSRTAKITFRVDGQRVRRQNVPRITVPGEVLAPYELNYEYSGTESSSEEEDVGRSPAPSRVTPAPQPRIKLVKMTKPPKAPKTPKTPKPQASALPGGSVGPEVSTSKALAKLQPPPENAVAGSSDAPWLQLTTYELAKLRKRMKKNAAWAPSDTMIARELKNLGRGVDAYKAAKQKADEEGQLFEDYVPSPVMDTETGTETLPPGALSVEAMAAEEKSLSNKGMKLNEAKKLKREQLAKLAAEEAEESARKMAEAAKAMFTPSRAQSLADQPSQAKTETKRPKQKKRKRDSVPETEAERPESLEVPTSRPPFKRTKTETPVPPPQIGSNSANSHSAQETAVQTPQLTANGPTIPRTTPVPVPIPGGQEQAAKAQPTTSPASSTNAPASNGAAVKQPTETPVPPPTHGQISPLQSTTPIFPPVRETRKSQAARKQEQQQPPPPQTASTTAPAPTQQPVKPPSRASSPAIPPSTTSAHEPELPAATTRRPGSRASKAASQEPQQPTVASERPRRASTARNTPAPEAARPASRRQAKRPAPGVISRTNSGGNSAVGRRKAAPRKNSARASTGGGKKDRTSLGDGGGGGGGEMMDVEVDDEGNVIDPDEARYCLCNRVSFGTMVQCDNVESCKLEWFHLECVGLTEIPARTTKWYCPECRVRLNIGERGEVNARGVRT